MSEAKRRLSDEVEQGRLRTRRTGGLEKLLSFTLLSLTPLVPPPQPNIEEEGTSSSPVHELAQVRAQEVQETPLLALRVKPKTSDIANTCHILSVKNGLFSKEFQPKTCSS